MSMKASHTTTPRTLSECDFQSWADPIERDPSGIYWWLNDLLLAIFFVATLAAIAVGWI